MYRERFTQTSDGVTVFQARWTVESPTGTVVIVHGYADHIGRYEHVARHLNGAGFSVLGFDLRGMGRSGGEPGKITDYQTLLADLNAFIEEERAQSDTPVILLGHSFGGTLAALTAVQQPQSVNVLVLSSPAFRLVPNRLLQPFGKIVARWLPRFTTPGVERAAVSRDPLVVAAATDDPLCYDGRIDAHTGWQLISAGRTAARRSGDLRVPVLGFHGTGDRIADFRATKSFIEGVSASPAEFHALDGWYHEALNEPDKQTVLDLVSGFSSRVLQATASATSGSDS